MATDATGTPTPKGIPKFNVGVDAPSGLGSNAQMDAIDTLLDSYVGKPSGIVSGEVPVWNGSAWVRSSVTRIGVGSLGSGSPSASNFLRGDGSWAAVAQANFVTALPGSPSDGDECILVDSLTAPTYQWRLKYIAAATTYKWYFVGGHAAYSRVDTSESSTSATFVDLTTVGPTFTLPVAGDWHVAFGSAMRPADGANQAGVTSVYWGTTPVDADSVQFFHSTGNKEGSVAREVTKTALASTTVVKLQYRVAIGGTTCAFRYRWMSIRPIRVG